MSSDFLKLLDELIEQQQEALVASARRVVPYVTRDDLLQPNDFPDLELHPHFRYEEGVFHGLLSARASLLSVIASRSD